MLKAICSKKDLSCTEYYSCVCDIIYLDQLDKLRFITHHITTTRFQHCLNVSYYSYIVCRKLKLNAHAAARAGLMHDLFYDDRKEYKASRSKNEPKYNLMHSLSALENARKITNISPLEKDIIEKHMWPMTKPLPKYGESYVITLIDKYCAVLEFCVPKLRRILLHKK